VKSIRGERNSPQQARERGKDKWMSVHGKRLLLLPLFSSITLSTVFSFPFHYVELIYFFVVGLM